jgi:hypothetical protein
MLTELEVRRAIADEPELPDAMPDAMWEIIRTDRDAAQEAFRSAVRQTKEGILQRLALDAVTEPGQQRIVIEGPVPHWVLTITNERGLRYRAMVGSLGAAIEELVNWTKGIILW